MRKIIAMMIMVLGIIALVAAIAALVWNWLSLPHWSVLTEGRWTAYGIHEWAFFMWELPLGLALLLGGFLLWPSKVSRQIGKVFGSIALIIALASLVTLASLIYGVLRNVLEPSPAPLTVLEKLSFLLKAIVELAPLMVVTVLAVSAAWKLLRTRIYNGRTTEVKN